METYRLSSKLRENDTEYLIQTANDANLGAVYTTTYVNGVVAERIACPHPVQVDPQEVLSLVKGSHQEKKREVETLLNAYRTVIRQGDAETMYQLGTAFFYKGFFTEARELFYHTTLARKEHHQGLNYLGMTELMLGNKTEAIEAARRAVELRPRFADYRNNLGEALLADRQCEEAIAQFEEAVSINMYYSDAYFNLALAHMTDAHLHADPAGWPQRHTRILDLVRKAALIYERYRGREYDAGMEALQRGDVREAMNIFKSIRETRRNGSRQEFASFHMKFLTLGDWVSEKAIADRISFLRGEINKNPTYVDLHAELAQCYLEQSKMAWQNGIDQYAKAIEINRGLKRVSQSKQAAEDVYERMTSAMSQITEKG